MTTHRQTTGRHDNSPTADSPPQLLTNTTSDRQNCKQFKKTQRLSRRHSPTVYYSWKMNGRKWFCPVADPEGVRGVRSNPPLRPNYFIFMGNYKKTWVNWSNRTPLSNLNPLSKNPGSAPGSVNHIVSLFVKADKKIPNNTSSRVTLVSRHSHIIPNQSSLMNHFAPSLFTFQGFNKLVYIWVSLTNDTSEPVMPALEKIIFAWVISKHKFIVDQVASNKRKAGRNFSFFYPNEKNPLYMKCEKYRKI